MIKYKAEIHFSTSVTPVDVIRETDKSVFFLTKHGHEYKELKETKAHKYFDTHLEAVNYVQVFLLKEISSAKRRWMDWEEKMRKFKLENEPWT